MGVQLSFQAPRQILMNILLINRQDPGKEKGNLSRPTKTSPSLGGELLGIFILLSMFLGNI